jgi:hypothetical protein
LLMSQNYSIETKITVSWEMMPRSLVENYRPSEQVGIAITFYMEDHRIESWPGDWRFMRVPCCLSIYPHPPVFIRLIGSWYSYGIQAGRPGFNSR